VRKSGVELPKYQQIRGWLMERLSSGTYGAGDRFFSENELKERFGASNLTVRQALGLMESDGLIERRRGSGAFVLRVPERPSGITVTDRRFIGILTGDIEFSDNLALGRMLTGLHKRAAEKGYIVCLGHNSAQPLTDAHCDGIIALGFPDAGSIRTLKTCGLPVVGAGSNFEGIFPGIVSDFESKGRDVMRFFRGFGLRRVTALGSGRDAAFVAGRMLPAMRAALKKEFKDMSLSALINSPCGDRAALKKHLKTGPAPDALLLMNWLSVSPALQTLAELGLRVPKDISVLVNGENALALHTDPPLSIIKSDLDGECRMLTEILFEMIKTGDRGGVTRKTGYEIINRGSVRV
jgi:DNA-binding LacI/PurR family transcriptional regulator/DNA-binding transcriptional regulator YhcF (GntR family)